MTKKYNLADRRVFRVGRFIIHSPKRAFTNHELNSLQRRESDGIKLVRDRLEEGEWLILEAVNG